MTDPSMSTPNPPSPKPRRLWPLAAALVVLAGVGAGAVVGFGGLKGPSAGSEPCAGTAEITQRVKPTIRGEVAAMVPAAGPLLLSQLTFTRDDGSKAALADWKGRTVLLNLWATWCVPCRAEMPALDKLQATLGSKDFEVVTVNVDTGGAEKPKRFLADIGVQALTYYADSTLGIFKALQKTSRSRGLPTTILIDGRGCEIGTMYGPAAWDQADARKLIEAALGR